MPRIALVDTYCDEKGEALLAAETLGEALAGVRLDTPASRRGRFTDIIREVRWELDLRGFHQVRIYVSGALDEENIPELRAAGAEGFGVGTHLSNAPVVDFALDVVEVDGKRLPSGEAWRPQAGHRREGCFFLCRPREARWACPDCGGRWNRSCSDSGGGRRLQPRPMRTSRASVLRSFPVFTPRQAGESR